METYQSLQKAGSDSAKNSSEFLIQPQGLSRKRQEAEDLLCLGSAEHWEGAMVWLRVDSSEDSGTLGRETLPSLEIYNKFYVQSDTQSTFTLMLS
jgi:hypothetical protein